MTLFLAVYCGIAIVSVPMLAQGFRNSGEVDLPLSIGFAVIACMAWPVFLLSFLATLVGSRSRVR